MKKNINNRQSRYIFMLTKESLYLLKESYAIFVSVI